MEQEDTDSACYGHNTYRLMLSSLKIIFWRDFKGTVGRKVLKDQGVKIRLLRGAIQIVYTTMGRCFCAEVLYVEQFTSEIISLGWSSGLHGYMQMMLLLIFMFSLFGFQLYYY